MQQWEWVLPAEVFTNGVQLFWTRGDKKVRPQVDFWRAFLGLADAEPDAIVRFARRWGVLGLCTHGLPAQHSRHAYPWVPGGEGVLGCPPMLLSEGVYQEPLTLWLRRAALRRRTRPGEGVYQEPLTLWRFYARQAGALLRMAAALEQGRPIDGVDMVRGFVVPPQGGTARLRNDSTDEGWQQLGVVVPPQGGAARLQDWAPSIVSVRLPEQPDTVTLRRMVTGAIDRWLQMGTTRLMYGMYDGGDRPQPQVAIRGHGLFSALSVQIALAVSRSDGLGFCSGCGLSFVMARRPRTGQRRYCEACRLASVPLRHAKRDQRARQAGRRAGATTEP